MTCSCMDPFNCVTTGLIYHQKISYIAYSDYIDKSAMNCLILKTAYVLVQINCFNFAPMFCQ